jgi:hypothetical protein
VLFAGLAFTLRDLTQEWLGRKVVLVAIVLGALLSYWVTSNRDLAVASGVAFLPGRVGDRLDPVPPDRLRKSGLHRRQIIGKIWTTIFAVLMLLALRRWVIPRDSRPADEPTVPQIAWPSAAGAPVLPGKAGAPAGRVTRAPEP